MLDAGLPTSPPVAATIDLQYRLPPPQQLIYTPTILASVIILVVALVIVVYLSRRARIRAKKEARREAQAMAEKILAKRGGAPDDIDRLRFIFQANPKLDPAALVMVKTRFHDELRPLLDQAFENGYGERLEKLFFPPPKDTRQALAKQTRDVKQLVEEQKSSATATQTPAAILDLMDATLKPGMVTRLSFDGIEGGHECLVMGHDMNTINVTLPANSDRLLASLQPGLRIEGTLESGPSLLAYTANVIQAIGGSMPYCRMSSWRTAWEIRKRDSIRLPISLEIDFQHISTSTTDSISMSNLSREIGAVRPGRLVDLSLGGCAIETPSATSFKVGDMIRFSQSLVAGTPPATLLGAVVSIDAIDPLLNEGAMQRLHIQFLVIDDVSQRILVRTLRQLQDATERNEWLLSQQLLQQMRRNNIHNIGSPAPAAMPRRDSTGQAAKPGTRSMPKVGSKPTTRSMPKVPRQPPPHRPNRPSTRKINNPRPPEG